MGVAIFCACALVAAACGSDDAALPGPDPALDADAGAIAEVDASAGDDADGDDGDDATAEAAIADDATAGVDAMASEPIWQEVAGGEDCRCADGSDWSFWVREADPAKVVLYFQGGGACFDATSCSFTTGTYKVTGGSEDDPTGADGIFDFDNQANPLADWSFVFVPYCTGDVHLGDNRQDYGDGLVVDHNGFVNGEFALEHLVERFGEAGEVFVTGSSAGGVPAPLFAGLVSDRLPDAAVTVLADGSGAYADSPAVNAAIGALWGTFANVPSWEVNAGLTPADWSIPGLFTQAGLHAPDIVFARHDHAFDSVQESFAAAAGTLSADVATLIAANAAEIEAEGVPLVTYVAPGTDHTILGSGAVYSQTVEGVPFVDWLAELVGGGVPDDVACVECGGPAGG